MTDIIKSILAINPNAQVTVIGDGVDNIEWKNNTIPIPANEILAKQQELIAEYKSKQYQRNRAKEYPSIVDQLDNIFHNGIDGWKQTIQEIKNKYPKE